MTVKTLKKFGFAAQTINDAMTNKNNIMIIYLAKYFIKNNKYN
jgi:hypothetical protein